MLLDPNVSQAISSKGLYLNAGVGLVFYGTIGLNTVVQSSHSSKISSNCKLNMTCMGSFNFLRDINVVGLILGNYTTILDGVRTLGQHDMSRLTTSYCGVYMPEPEISFIDFKGGEILDGFPCTIVGNDVWIGPEVMLLAGVIIGHGAIVEPGTILTKNVPPYAIVGGRPGRIKGWRFPQKLIEKALKSQWFLYDWRGVDLPWSKPAECIARMSDYVAEHQPKAMNEGYRYDVVVSKHKIDFNPSIWSLEQQLQSSCQTSDFNEILNLPRFKKRNLL